MKNVRRLLALLLCLLLCASLLPAAYAAEEATEVPDAAESDAPETQPAPDETADTGETDPDPDPTAPANETEDPDSPAEPTELAGELEEETAAKEARNGIVASGTCGAQGDNLTWTLDDSGTLTISGEGEMTSSPSWSSYCDKISSVVIESGVTSIANRAFSYCSRLTSVTIPGSVTSIGNAAFLGCYNLESVTIPDSVTSIGTDAFTRCDNLTSVTIPPSVTSIGANAFKNCSSLVSVPIPPSVTYIDTAVFYECSNLTSVTIPDSVTSIGEAAFEYCSSLTSVTIPDSVTGILDRAFGNCGGLKTIRFEGSAPGFESDPFYGVTATVYYPSNRNWSSSDRQQYGGELTWVPWTPLRITGTIQAWDDSADCQVRLFPAGQDTKAILRAWQNNSLEDALYTATIKDDRFMIEDVAPGNYCLVITKPGKYTPLVREIQVSDDLDLGSFKLRLYGDLNNNGQTDALDVLNLQLYIGSMAGSLGSLSGEELTDARCSADVDLDGEVTALDVLNMQLFIGSHAGTMAQLP